MSGAAALVRKEMRDIVREKSLVVAFLIQLFLAGFSTLLLTGLTALYSPDAIDIAPDATVAYVGPGGFDRFLIDAGNLRVERPGFDAALDGFREGRYAAVYQETHRDADGVRSVTMLLADGELATTLLVTQSKSLLLEYEQELRQERGGRLDHEPMLLPADLPRGGSYAFVATTLLPLLAVTPVLLSGAIAGDALSQESRTRTLLLLRSTPLSAGQLVLGKLAVPVLLVPLQVAVWLVLFALNGFPAANPLLILAATTAMGLLVCGVGIWVAAAVRNESATQAVYALVVLVLAVLSLLLPRDPLNMLAHFVAGRADGAAATSLWLIAAAGIAAAAAAAWWTRRRIRTDRL